MVEYKRMMMVMTEMMTMIMKACCNFSSSSYPPFSRMINKNRRYNLMICIELPACYNIHHKDHCRYMSTNRYISTHLMKSQIQNSGELTKRMVYLLVGYKPGLRRKQCKLRPIYTCGNSIYYFVAVFFMPKYTEFGLTSTMLCIKFAVFFMLIWTLPR